jgi:hypothetical protein
LDIPESVVKQYLAPNVYEKPRIELGNYYLKWNEASNGIHQKEFSELKGFIRSAIPYLDRIYELLNQLQKSKNSKRRGMHAEFSPVVHIPYHKDEIVSYDLFMIVDGSTQIDRTEHIRTVTDIMTNTDTNRNRRRPYYNKSLLNVKWNLGELLYNRQNK